MRPTTVQLVETPSAIEQEEVLSLAVTMYPVIDDPPVLVGADQNTLAWLSAVVADTPVGTPGRPMGVTEVEGSEVSPDPVALVAVTEKVTPTPSASPMTMHDVVAVVHP